MLISSLILLAGASFSTVGPPVGPGHDIVIRSREGKGITVRKWVINGALADGRTVVVTLDFPERSKAIKVGLAVAGKSWGEKVIDEAEFPNVNIRSLGLNQFGPHLQVIFDYGVTNECDKATDLHPEVTVDFTREVVQLHRDPGYCSKQ